MTNEEIKKREIKSALAAIATGNDFLETSEDLLAGFRLPRSELTEKLLGNGG